MTQPARVGIIGAGGVGGYYGGLLARAGHAVSFLARGANLSALRERGVVVRTAEEEWTSAVVAGENVRELSAPFGDGDLALVTTKAYSLSEVSAAVRTFAERGATILPLLNGVEAAETLVKLGVPREQIIGGVTYISAVRIAPGTIHRRTAAQRVIVGELPRGTSARVKQVAAMFEKAGAQGEASEDITLALWQKFVFLASLAAGCGLARLPLGPVRDNPLGARLLERAVREAIAVGRARGVALREDEEEQTLSAIESLPAGTEPSLLLDIRSGRRTEVDVLSGAVARFAAEAGIETPIHDTAAIALAQAPSTGT
jgi:2-dehydropantoate 2-reductase